MEAMAKARFIRVTPRKARRVVDLIRGKQATEAVTVLKFAPQAASEPVLKVVQSAIANARVIADRDNVAFDETKLVIKTAVVDEDQPSSVSAHVLRVVLARSSSGPATSLWLLLRLTTRKGPDSGTEGSPARVPSRNHHRSPFALVR